MAKSALRRIRNYLAGQMVGRTRDESLLQEVLKCAFARAYLERRDPLVDTAVDPESVAKIYTYAYQQVRRAFPQLFGAEDEILLGPTQLWYVNNELSSLRLKSDYYDLIGDIYEAFVGSAYRGQEGQFFTPKVAVRALVELVSPQEDDLIVDPACGSGSFLVEAARFVRDLGNLDPARIQGIDKDESLVRLAQLHLALLFDSLFPVQCADSLLWSGANFDNSPTKSMAGRFTLVLTNPPFGSKIVALPGDARQRFDLAHRWRLSKETARFEKRNDLAANPAPQVLFVERCLSLLGPGGRLGIVVPESLLSNPSHRYVAQYILDRATPIAVIGMPEELFKTSGRGGTHTKVCLLVLEKRSAPRKHKVFMAEAVWCGHDSRGREIPRNDLPAILDNFRKFRDGQSLPPTRLGFAVDFTKVRDSILAPRFYDPEPLNALAKLRDTHEFHKVSVLVRKGFLSISTGDEIGKLAYGTGPIPFVRTSDISNWELKADPKHGVSREVFEEYSVKQDVREGDILMVRDGTYLIGTCAYITRRDTEIVYQSHLYKIRVSGGGPFDSYLLLAALSSEPVLAQVRSMSFTQDVIDTLGNRIHDIVLPIPKSEARRHQISEMVRLAIESRLKARELAREARESLGSA